MKKLMLVIAIMCLVVLSGLFANGNSDNASDQSEESPVLVLLIDNDIIVPDAHILDNLLDYYKLLSVF